jgi:DNA polymerase I-like protein with 3'-5' exonuclease and polymerase domains
VTLPQVAAIVKDCMENALELRVPLAVKMAVGETWVRSLVIHVVV